MKTSQSLKEMIPDLIKAQKALRPVLKKGTNPHFHSDYAEYQDVIEEIKKVLNANNLWISHPTHFEGEKLIMETIIVHTSGEWVSSELPVINKVGTDQGLGSSITYTKRYSSEALMGVSTTGDDDGNAATFAAEKTEVARPQASYQDNQHSKNLVSEAQIKRLFAIANKHSWSQDRIKEYMKFKYQTESTKDLTKQNYDLLIGAIEATPIR
jgi:hypothetical protein